MLRLNKTLTDDLDIVFSNIDLLGTQWRVLRLIGASPDGLPVPHIARKLGMTRQGVQRLAERMHSLGFIAFEDNAHHAKSPRAVLTQKGRKAFRDGRAMEVDLGRRMMATLSDEEVRSTSRVLEKLVAHFRADHSPVTASASEQPRES
jgi:DNA-binding MarR family transcriptional regulator